MKKHRPDFPQHPISILFSCLSIESYSRCHCTTDKLGTSVSIDLPWDILHASKPTPASRQTQAVVNCNNGHYHFQTSRPSGENLIFSGEWRCFRQIAIAFIKRFVAVHECKFNMHPVILNFFDFKNYSTFHSHLASSNSGQPLASYADPPAIVKLTARLEW
jgi:hypothetical protein